MRKNIIRDWISLEVRGELVDAVGLFLRLFSRWELWSPGANVGMNADGVKYRMRVVHFSALFKKSSLGFYKESFPPKKILFGTLGLCTRQIESFHTRIWFFLEF